MFSPSAEFHVVGEVCVLWNTATSSLSMNVDLMSLLSDVEDSSEANSHEGLISDFSDLTYIQTLCLGLYHTRREDKSWRQKTNVTERDVHFLFR